MRRYEYYLKGLDCAACGLKIQDKIAENSKYQNVSVNYNILKLSFEVEDDNTYIKEEIVEVVSKVEPEVEIIEYFEYLEKQKKQITQNNVNDNENDTLKNTVRLIVGVTIAIISLTMRIFSPSDLTNTIGMILIIIAYIILLWRTANNTISLLKNKVIDENFLVTISCIGAFFINKQTEGLMVILLYEIGKILEVKAVNNTRKSIAELMDIRPEYARIKKENGDVDKVDPNDVNIGDIIVVNPGERIPLDGVIKFGNSNINTKSITGESKPNHQGIGSSVMSGSINETGVIEVEVSSKYEDSTVSRILNLVENATDKKAKTETFVSKLSRIYTPIVVIIAVLVFVLLPQITQITYKEALYRALIFLVISCPCAIVISVPLSYFSGIGAASKRGILIKGSNYLDALKDIRKIVFDKTGTLTKGNFEIRKIVSLSNKYSEDEILLFAALAEKNSNHLINNAISNKLNEKLSKDKIFSEMYEKMKTGVYNNQEISGKGVFAEVEGRKIKIGNFEYVRENAINKDEVTLVTDVGTIIYESINDEVVGYIILSDVIKPEAMQALGRMTKKEISLYMFTGDNASIAVDVAKQLKIDNVKAEMLPQDKYSEMEKMLKDKTTDREKVAFVGDGINDSPVLALSDVGISMGGVGASSAVEASDVVLMTDDLNKIAESIEISKYTNKIIIQNLVFALGIKVAVLILSAFGIAMMWQAVFADVGVTLITILNTLRILRMKIVEKSI